MPEPIDTDPRAPAHTSRPAPIDQEPGARLGATLDFLDDIDQVARRLQPLLRTLNRMTGLPPAQVRALMALAHGDRTPVGTRPDLAALTALAHQGFAAPADPPPGGETGEMVWWLTDAGHAALEQVEGLRIRALSTLVNGLDDRQVDAIHAAARGIVEALDGLPAAADEHPPRTLP